MIELTCKVSFEYAIIFIYFLAYDKKYNTEECIIISYYVCSHRHYGDFVITLNDYFHSGLSTLKFITVDRSHRDNNLRIQYALVVLRTIRPH